MKLEISKEEADVIQYLLMAHVSGPKGSQMDHVDNIIKKLNALGASLHNVVKSVEPRCRQNALIVFMKNEKNS